jgi:DNA-binding transcriptional MerR regulator
MYTVKQLADLAGVTPRTLHHYDEIGLLKPTRVGDNGYRYYDGEALLRLQQVLLYRELRMPLDQIKRVVGRPDFDVLTALARHRAALQAEALRLRRLIRTIDRTEQHLKGRITMEPRKLFEGFSEEEEEKLAEEAAQRWDSEIVRESNQQWKRRSPEERKKILDEGNAIYADMIKLMSKHPADAAVQAVVARWRQNLSHFWSPSDEQLLGLADLYNDDTRFRANFDAMAPGLADFMRLAVRAYVEKRKG